MAETPERKFSWTPFIWLSVLFAVGNLVFTNLFFQLVGFPGFVMGIVVSGSITLLAAFLLMSRRAGSRERVGG